MEFQKVLVGMANYGIAFVIAAVFLYFCYRVANLYIVRLERSVEDSDKKSKWVVRGKITSLKDNTGSHWFVDLEVANEKV